MGLFRFSWVEMSGGFNQVCVIDAPNKELASQVFTNEVGLIGPGMTIEEIITREVVTINHTYKPGDATERLIEELREKVREAPVATLQIHTCLECPYLKQERYYTEDSWELAHDWFCEKNGSKKIEGYVGWNEEKRVKIPTWCPILKSANV